MAGILMASNLGNTSGRSRTRIAQTLGSAVEILSGIILGFRASGLNLIEGYQCNDRRFLGFLSLPGLLDLRMEGALGRIPKSQYKPKGLPRVDKDR